MTDKQLQSLIERYGQAWLQATRWQVIDVVDLNGHPTVYLEYTYTSADGSARQYRLSLCACDLTEGRGWQLSSDPRRTRTSLAGGAGCIERAGAIRYVQLRLRERLRLEYLGRRSPDQRASSAQGRNGDSPASRDFVKYAIERLVVLNEQGEWIDIDSYYGRLYLASVARVLDVFIGHLWHPAYELGREKKITVDEGLVVPYFKPPSRVQRIQLPSPEWWP